MWTFISGFLIGCCVGTITTVFIAVFSVTRNDTVESKKCRGKCKCRS